jgi:hypothetical protein
VKKLSLLCVCLTASLLVRCSGSGGGSQMTPPPVQLLSISSSAPPNGTLGQVYNGGAGFTVAATGGEKPYHWTWAPAASSQLPPGLTLADNGSINGTPTSAGPFNVVVTVNDSATPAAHANATYAIAIISGVLTITSGAPPGGEALTAYGDVHSIVDNLGKRVNATFFKLNASGGTGQYNWSLSAAAGSALPSGINCCSPFFQTGPPLSHEGVRIQGALFGSPSAVGTFNVIVTVADAGDPSDTVSTNYAITIVPPPAPTIDNTPRPAIATLNSPYVGYTFTAAKGLPPFNWSETGPLPPGMMLSGDGTLSGKPTSAGSFPIQVSVKDAAGQNGVSAQAFTIEVLAKGFVPTGSMSVPRVVHTATTLANGKVLVLGDDPTSEVFDPTSGTFAASGMPTTQRGQHTATLLKDGKVLIAGGIFVDALASAELYDASTGTFVATGNLTTARFAHTATRLVDGRILIAGGADNAGNPLSSAELFDEAAGTFTATGSLANARAGHTATLLKDGRVLIVGGSSIAAAEIYDPASGTFSTTGSLHQWRMQHTATLLASGKVVVIGGQGGASNISLTTAEVFDPASGLFTQTVGVMESARAWHVAALLPSGKVLVAGGVDDAGKTHSSAELFDPASGKFADTADMTAVRFSSAAAVLNDGTVLVTGGYDATGASLASAEIYQ